MENLDNFIKEHVLYEISMLHYSFGQLQSKPDNRNKSNVLIESFILHSRNLIDFFLMNKKIKKDDVIALEYKTKHTVWIELVQNHRAFLNKMKRRADKELAHLTLQRKSGISDDLYQCWLG